MDWASIPIRGHAGTKWMPNRQCCLAMPSELLKAIIYRLKAFEITHFWTVSLLPGNAKCLSLVCGSHSSHQLQWAYPLHSTTHKWKQIIVYEGSRKSVQLLLVSIEIILFHDSNKCIQGFVLLLHHTHMHNFIHTEKETENYGTGKRKCLLS